MKVLAISFFTTSILAGFASPLHAEKVIFDTALEVMPDAPKPYAVVGDYGGTLDAVWDTQTKSFDSFTLQFGTWPVSAQFNAFVYIVPGWNPDGVFTDFRLPLPVTIVPLAGPCCGLNFDNGTVTFRMDGWDLSSPDVPAWFPGTIADCINRPNFLILVLNQGIDCPTCVVVDGPAVNNGALLMRADFSIPLDPELVKRDGFEEPLFCNTQ